ncbi:hypothetical protein [Providencia huaxiensis]|uniref:hypothetical protein n=2 Tax=Providencia TaxID=586 RepID=UPI001B39849C|nr:hypothetical protein [Providencia huaxiensis]MBQ0533704.1 hypothetical protein [Providencia huaxiensis]MBQ0589570.1 hypothetical protein [Providencia huaxiensis]MDI7239927.1 hypothetical protein [Providencia huaxiensis]
MTLDTKVNNQASIFININNKVIPYKKTSVIDNLNIIKPLSSESYNKINFAIQNSEFHESAQPVLNQLPYSPPVEKLLLPYTYHEDDLVSSLDIFKNSIEIKNDSLISEKKDTELMPLNKISTTETKVFKDFRLNRSAGRFSNLILEIKSTHEKGIRYLKNILKKNNNEELCVKFENGKAKITDEATIARKNLMKQHEKTNYAKATSDIIYTIQQEKSDLYNNYKILLDEMIRVESKINKLISGESKPEEEIHPLYQNHKQFEKLNIIDIIDFPISPNGKVRDINVIFNKMRATIEMLEDEYNNFKQVIEKEEKNKDDEIKNTDKISSFELTHSSSNVSLSSSGYHSDDISNYKEKQKSLIPKRIKTYDFSQVKKIEHPIKSKKSHIPQLIKTNRPSTTNKTEIPTAIMDNYLRKTSLKKPLYQIPEPGKIRKADKITYGHSDSTNRLHKGEKAIVNLPEHLKANNASSLIIKQTQSSKLRQRLPIDKTSQIHKATSMTPMKLSKIEKEIEKTSNELKQLSSKMGKEIQFQKNTISKLNSIKKIKFNKKN